ncbi:MAG: hypothetical protein A2X35_03440 [Elusimicrobia bacterium GWA2_61_42]|nr:MAG: hypothetical protein A2X35_03440 [Elusimicrobia bacterium GWA2_61_42]OGR77638.1 MAG: hypothetical protein A2X38_09680 [Elusimicrobia bacterium GWC2_61_25]
MIVSDLERASRRIPPGPGVEKALEFLGRPGLRDLPDGRYEIDGERVFALVQRYETAPAGEPEFEAHRKYIDLQFLAAGTEVIGWAPLSRLAVTRPYDAQKDVCFGLVTAEERTAVLLKAGQLAVLYPEDAHAPKLAAGAPSQVTKIVIKISV